MLSRNSLANSIYADYSALEKKNLTNDSVNELLNTKNAVAKKPKNNNLYLINNVDYAQQQVIKQVNESGLNRQDYLRKLFKEAVIVPCPSLELKPLVEGLKPIEENLKQLEKHFCKTKTIDMAKLDENMAELKKLVAETIDYDYDKEN